MNEDLHPEFLVESHEHLDRLDRDLVELEKNPRSRETLASIFRTVHTLKGTSGFFGLTRLQSVTHAGESLLAGLRDGGMLVDARVTTALLSMVDAIHTLLASVERSGDEGDGDYTSLIEELTRLHDARPPGTNPLSGARPPTAGPPGPQAGSDVTDRSLRVDVQLLDRLVNLVGELTLTRNQILQLTAKQTDLGFVTATRRLNLVTSELQEGVMRIRRQPIGRIWGKFPRVVRDIAAQCGKRVRVEMEGKETELDKTIIEAIKDPLTHIVRNSVDHGIETPAERATRGKPAEGCVRLRAFHESGHINIEISDDGAGIDPMKIRAKAVRAGLISSAQARRLSERELGRLVFAPGLSTADKVSHISGRGVGMDVVKTNIEKIGGQVDIQSVVGRRTTLMIKIPVTLASLRP